MYKRIVCAAAVLMVVAVTLPASAAERLDSGHQLQPAACPARGGAVISVTQRVVNDADSGGAGNYWALDRYIRRIQVWRDGDGGFCAVVRYAGRFDALEGETSPGGTETLTGDEDGTFQGGYRANIVGTMRNTPAWSTHGALGQTDYECGPSGACPGAVNWLDQYFEPGWDFQFDWWGWVYRAGRYGTWINSGDGNSGDIG